MLDDVRALLVLQDRDRRLLTLAKDLDKLPLEETRAQSKLNGAENDVNAARKVLQDLEVNLKRIELDIGTRKTTIQRLKVQQFETRKNEEYQAIGHEITRYEKEVDGLETKELELMEEIDAVRATLKQAQAAYDHQKSLVAEDLAAIAQRRMRLEEERADLTRDREALAAKAPAAILPLYQRLMKTKDGLAVVPLQDGRCAGCHLKLIASTVVAVQSGRELARCEECGRILYQE